LRSKLERRACQDDGSIQSLILNTQGLPLPTRTRTQNTPSFKNRVRVSFFGNHPWKGVFKLALDRFPTRQPLLESSLTNIFKQVPLNSRIGITTSRFDNNNSAGLSELFISIQSRSVLGSLTCNFMPTPGFATICCAMFCTASMGWQASRVKSLSPNFIRCYGGWCPNMQSRLQPDESF